MSLAKQVFAGTAFIAVAGAFGRVLSLLTVPVISARLGPAPYGMAALVSTVISLAAVLATLGIDMAYTRFYLQEPIEHRAAVEAFCWRFAGFGSVTVALLVFGGWTMFGHGRIEHENAVALYSVLMILLSSLGTMATAKTRLQGGYRRMAVAAVIGAIVAALSSIATVFFWRQDYWVILVGSMAGSISTSLLMSFPSLRQVISQPPIPSFKKKEVALLGLAGCVTAPMYWVTSSADRWVLARNATIADVGVYSMAANVALIGLMLNSSLTLTWFPEASRTFSHDGTRALVNLGRLWSRMVALLAVVWVAISAAGGDFLRLLTAVSFHSGAHHIPWLAGGVFFYGVSSLANTSLFLEGSMRFSAYVWIAGALYSILLSVLLSRWIGPQGAAIAQCLTYATIASAIFLIAQRRLPLVIPWFRLLLVSGVALIAGVILSPSWSPNPLVSLLFKFPIGVLVSIVVVLVVAPDWAQRGMRRIFVGAGT